MAAIRNENLWVFNAGNHFSGNPKWLFLHLVHHHPEIRCVWLCYDKATLETVRNLGYRAAMYRSAAGKLAMRAAGVYVVDQMKEVFQPELNGIKVLNLWHGVGCKSVELGMSPCFLSRRIAKKHIQNQSVYENQMLFLVTSPLMEKHFVSQMGLHENQLIRAGYPCCQREASVATFEHDILKEKGLPPDTEILLYAPTYRDQNPANFLGKAIPNMPKLLLELEKNHQLLIFKLHPMMEKDAGFMQFKAQYGNLKRLLFWDNQKDIYEIFDRIDTAIVDYSSIFYDLLAGGVRHFIRYFFDRDDRENVRDFVFDLEEKTCGPICTDFDTLLACLSTGQTPEEAADQARIYREFWAYADPHIYEKILGAVKAFHVVKKPLPTLYSFDLFDTLIRRSCGEPSGIFRGVQQKMEADGSFPPALVRHYPVIRHQCELNEREYRKKAPGQHGADQFEIRFDAIFGRLAALYGLNETQVAFLKNWELKLEYAASLPCEEKVAEAKALIESGEKVILLSDMYLPSDFVRKLLQKADPALADLPLYLSSDSGYQKTTGMLYCIAFHDVGYHFGKWVHFGDNPKADGKAARELGIQTRLHALVQKDAFETRLCQTLHSFDGDQVARLLRDYRLKHGDTSAETFAYSYVSLYFVPYVTWALKDAMAKGVQKVWFIARDGYHLQRIADAIIKKQGWPLETGYLFGSRKAWRIPSFIDRVDDDFFSSHGNLSVAMTFRQLLSALCMSEGEFDTLLSEFSDLKTDGKIPKEKIITLRESLRTSQKYHDFLLSKAASLRPGVLAYLQQEIDFTQKIAFVEYWGRGYTQDCFMRLARACGTDQPIPFYYLRSIYPSEGDSIRENFLSNDSPLLFAEAIFANLPYETTEGYRYENNRWLPVLSGRAFDKALHEALESELPKFASDLLSLPLIDEDALLHSLADFALTDRAEHPTSEIFMARLAHLKDSVELFSARREFAPPIRLRDLLSRIQGEDLRTSCIEMSMARSSRFARFVFRLYQNEFFEKPLIQKALRLTKRLLHRG